MVRESGARTGGRTARGRRLSLVGVMAGSLIAVGTCAGGTDWERTERAEGAPYAHGLSETTPLRNASHQTTIAITLSRSANPGAGATMSRPLLSFLASPDEPAQVTRRLVAISDCEQAVVQAVLLRDGMGERRLMGADARAFATVERTVKVRDQTLAVLALHPSAPDGDLGSRPAWLMAEIALGLTRASGPTTRDAGPFTATLNRAVMNYGGVGPGWHPPVGGGTGTGRHGTAAVCSSVSDCVAAAADFLIIAAQSLSSSPILLSFAQHQAEHLGLNVAIVSTASLPDLSASSLRGFIRDVYASGSAEHFGDGHLGFVLLVGDAYSDDNASVMIPVYNGYGGSEVASDHYYACLSGDDDFEDVMLGRLSVGNQAELAAVITKALGYSPQVSGEAWHDRVLLVAGLFYTAKDAYVSLFNEYDDVIPDGYTVDRIYRHDFANDQQCATAVVDAVNDGYLIVNYAGDGWISSWYTTFTTSDIASLTNADRLPIVLSMACMTGWFDNTTSVDATGSYDCLAEQLVNAPAKGAVACLAAPRYSDGGAFRTLTKKIYQAAFHENVSFIGEMIATAKLLHLQDGGEVEYARHFNLFGDPALLFASQTLPDEAPDLVLKPYRSEWSPDLPGDGASVSVDIEVTNDSGADAGPSTLRVTDAHEAGSTTFEVTVPAVGAWAAQAVVITIPSPALGRHDVLVEVDPDGEINELKEDNNAFTRQIYVYPHAEGFPVDLGAEALGLCAAPFNGSGKHILVMSKSGNVFAVASNGAVAWQSQAAAAPLDFGREIAPAAGDLTSDGVNEIVATKRMGLTALGITGDEIWTASTGDPVGHPVLADADSDGDLDVVVATRGFFSSPSKIVALDGNGGEIWAVSLSSPERATACPVAGDFDRDGRTDLAYGTSTGTVEAVTTDDEGVVNLWAPVDFGTSDINVLALADLDGDGGLELIVGEDGLHVLHAEDGTSAGCDVTLGSSVVSLAAGDTDGDDNPEVVAATAAGTVHLIEDGSLAWQVTLSGVPGSSAALADLDGDGPAEILIGTDAGYLHVLTGEGEDFVSPIPIPGGCGTPFAADLSGDGRPEVVVVSKGGLLFVFAFEGAGEPCAAEWAGLGRNAGHAGIYAQPLSGTITGNVILSGACRVIDDLVVSPGASLTLAAETVLEFDEASSAGLEIDGTFVVSAHPGAEAVLTGDSQVAGQSRWAGVRVEPGANADLVSCRVLRADIGLDADGAAVSLEGCDFSDNVFGAYLESCSIEIDNSGFSRSDSVGLYLRASPGTVDGCTFEENGKAGLECREESALTLRGSTFAGTLNGSGAIFIRYSNATVDSCAFSENAMDGVYLKNSSPRFVGSSFAGNRSCGVRCGKLAWPTLSWCTIVGNVTGVHAESEAFPDLGSDATPETGWNTIWGNSKAVVNNASPWRYIQAKRNWWGTTSPGPAMFVGRVNYTPWLMSPPTPPPTEVPEDGLPIAFDLLQNSPNPFNPSTVVTFTVPPPGGRVEVAVFDVGGKRVATLASATFAPGVHRATWDGRDERGETVASGVYFARMTAPGYDASRKMILLK